MLSGQRDRDPAGAALAQCQSIPATSASRPSAAAERRDRQSRPCSARRASPAPRSGARRAAPASGCCLSPAPNSSSQKLSSTRSGVDEHEGAQLLEVEVRRRARGSSTIAPARLSIDASRANLIRRTSIASICTRSAPASATGDEDHLREVLEVASPRAQRAAELLLARHGQRQRGVGERVLDDLDDLVGVRDRDSRGQVRRRLRSGRPSPRGAPRPC